MNDDFDGKLIFLASVAGVVAMLLGRYAVTSHGANPWTSEGVFNALRVAPHLEKAVRLVGGKINSMWRSERVNGIVGGAENSRHTMGLAVDIKPGGNLEENAKAVWMAAKAGDLGRVHKVLIEPGWIHVSWKRANETDKTMTHSRLVGPGWQLIERV